MENYKEIFSTIAGFGIGLVIITVLMVIVFAILYLIGLGKIFKKAGKSNWIAIVPFYNTYTLVEVAGLNWWYFLIAISGTILNILNINMPGFGTITNIASMAVYGLCFYNIAKKMHKNEIGYGIAGALVSWIMVIAVGFSKDEFDNSVVVSPNGPISNNTSNSTNNYTTTTQEKYCLGCGQKLTDGATFCTNCGKKVE